jgi:hypothetical protein
MRAGYVLVSEERESGSEYSGSTCCYCSSCASSCSGDEDSGDEDDDEEQGYWSDCSECRARRSAERRGRTGWRDGDGASCGNGYVNSRRVAEGGDVSFVFLWYPSSSLMSFIFFLLSISNGPDKG